ncbi:MAG: hypothetical protein ABRQ39_22370 [Candidatus Eremiobacterota bacterium]
MRKNFVKTINFKIYLLLFILFITCACVIYGLIKYTFNYGTSELVHTIFLLSSISYLFIALSLFFEILEYEIISYKITEDRISVYKMWLMGGHYLNWNSIRHFYICKIKKGTVYKKLYLLQDENGHEMAFGEEIKNLEELLELIPQKGAVEPEEVSEEKPVESFYYFSYKTKDITPCPHGVIYHNITNILIFLFLIGMTALIEYKWNSLTEEIKRILFFFQIINGCLIIPCLINLAFYKIRKTVTKISEVLLILINVVVIIFFFLTGTFIISIHPGMTYFTDNFYIIIIICLFILLFLASANIRTILWVIKNIQNKEINEKIENHETVNY